MGSRRVAVARMVLKRTRWPSMGSWKLCAGVNQTNEEVAVLWTISVVLLVLWLLGIVTSYMMGGFIHMLLALAIVTILIRVIQGRQTA